MKRASHLVRRFFGALRPGPPRANDAAWVESVLTPGELEIWSRMVNHDRRHSVAVARRVQHSFANTPTADDSRWLAAALLHDVGKLDAGLGVIGRASATLAGAAAGHDMAEAWSAKRGVTRRFGLYLRHAELGETRLRLAGAREEAAAWAGAHHAEFKWDALGFPEGVVAVLDAADDD
ncbi:MAG: hypothetical protein EXQ79_06135 [Acidimicrobiia bacterium]|nr:hypothetical protein [Acidimicrobiia bacterium]